MEERENLEERENRRDFYLLLGFGAISIALMYVFDVPYREGWMYWVGIPAIALGVMGILAAAAWLFRRWTRP
jgi:uncharacterized membrane protein YhaH (DUF805 family)